MLGSNRKTASQPSVCETPDRENVTYEISLRKRPVTIPSYCPAGVHCSKHFTT